MTIEVSNNDLDFSEMHERMQWYVDEGIIPFANSLVLKGDMAESGSPSAGCSFSPKPRPKVVPGIFNNGWLEEPGTGAVGKITYASRLTRACATFC